jgi:hypothetical protein
MVDKKEVEENKTYRKDNFRSNEITFHCFGNH